MEITELMKNPKFLDLLIQQIAEEVIKRLKNRPKKALAVFTGAAIGYKDSAQAINKLRQAGWEISVYATQAALSLFGEEKLKEDTGVSVIYHDGMKHDTNALYKEADAIILATLTMNTAAKIACGIADSEMLTIINHALMRGQTMVAAVDGACPDNKQRKALGMKNTPKGYRDMLHRNLVSLKDFGILLCNANELEETCLSGQAPVPQKADGKAPAASKQAQRIEKHVISRTDIQTHSGSGEISIPLDALVTQSAMELIRDLGLKVSRE